MARQVALTCLPTSLNAGCRRRFGGDEGFRKHQIIRGDRLVCLSDEELRGRGWYQDRDYVWHRPVGKTAKTSSAPVRPTLFDATAVVNGTGVEPTEARKLARVSDPTTSARAAKAIAPRTGSLKAILLDAYRAAGPDGLTDEEAGLRAGISLYSATKRCADLRNDGWIVAFDERKGSSGQARQVCRAVTEAASA